MLKDLFRQDVPRLNIPKKTNKHTPGYPSLPSSILQRRRLGMNSEGTSGDVEAILVLWIFYACSLCVLWLFSISMIYPGSLCLKMWNMLLSLKCGGKSPSIQHCNCSICADTVLFRSFSPFENTISGLLILCFFGKSQDNWPINPIKMRSQFCFPGTFIFRCWKWSFHGEQWLRSPGHLSTFLRQGVSILSPAKTYRSFIMQQ